MGKTDSLSELARLVQEFHREYQVPEYDRRYRQDHKDD